MALVGGDDVYRSVVARDSPIGRATLAAAGRLTGRSDMAPPLIRGIGPTLIPRPQRMYLRFGAPIDISGPIGTPAATWEQDVKRTVQTAVEEALDDLLAVRKTDPFRTLNPLSWRNAVSPATAGS